MRHATKLINGAGDTRKIFVSNIIQDRRNESYSAYLRTPGYYVH